MENDVFVLQKLFWTNHLDLKDVLAVVTASVTAVVKTKNKLAQAIDAGFCVGTTQSIVSLTTFAGGEGYTK